MKQIQGLIFDFDGLIIDTESQEFKAWQEIFKAYGGQMTYEQWAHCIGGSWGGFDPCDLLEEQLQKELDREQIHERCRRRSLELIRQQKPLPGVVERLFEAKRMGLKLAVASNSPRWWVQGHLEHIKLLACFDRVICREDITHSKPHPEIYLLAVSSLGINTDEGVAFEDSPNGLAAAKAAGLFSIAVPNAMTKRMDFSSADLVLNTLAELDLKMLGSGTKESA
jgi:HAD superfamily hydrolase (TIGR01509 family)